jgi:hypothetical protein
MCQEVLEACYSWFTLNDSRRRQFAEILCRTLGIPEGEIVENTHVIHFLGGRESDQSCKLRRKPKAVPPVQVVEVISF